MNKDRLITQVSTGEYISPYYFDGNIDDIIAKLENIRDRYKKNSRCVRVDIDVDWVYDELYFRVYSMLEESDEEYSNRLKIEEEKELKEMQKE